MANNTYNITTPITYQRQTAYPSQISALSFDPVSDVLWAGNGHGQVAAYYRNRARGVAFPAGDDYVSRLFANDQQIYAMTVAGHGLGSWGKGGVNKWYYRPPLNTMLSTFAQRGNTLVAVSNHAEFLVMNPTNGTVVRQVPCPPQVVHLHASHSSILSGSSDGLLRIHDVRTPMKRNSGSEQSVRAHQGSIHAIESSNNWVYTIGWSSRNGRPVPDPLVKIFDTRNLRSLSSFNFSAGPSFLAVHPQKATSLILASSTGNVNFVDVLNPTSGEFYQLEVESYLTSCAVSPTGSYISFGDAEGVIHLLSTAVDEETPFNGFEGQPIEWPDRPEPVAELEWSDQTPLSSIGTPYYNDYLLSAYDKRFQSVPEYYPPPMKIPAQITSSLKQVDGLAFAQLPKELQGKRNVIPLGNKQRQGRFRSDKSRRYGQSPSPEAPVETQRGDHVPRHYQRVEIEYSKFGVEDFDFGFYNKTPFSGLETHILNSYTNALIQAMHYVLPIRQIAKSHITTSCARENCLLCELGFVMRMLEDAKGINCQATNFCKTIPNIRDAGTYGVVDYVQDGQEANYGLKIQIFNRFLMEALKLEGNLSPKNPVIVPDRTSQYVDRVPPPISQLLCIDAKTITICSHCKGTRQKPDTSHIVDMVYPRKAASNEPTLPSDFASTLRNSLLRDYTHKATCQFCKQVTTQQTRRPLQPEDLPPVLLINASVHNEDALNAWRDAKSGHFLKPFIGLDISTEPTQVGGAVSHVIEDDRLVWYEVRSVVVEVRTPEVKSHLVAVVKVPPSESDTDHSTPWIAFNDFSVRSIGEDEALSFPAAWKVPTIIYLERVDYKPRLDLSRLPMEIDSSILSQDISLSVVRDKARIMHELLRSDELPRPGTMIAIDAEFVQMQQEETDLFNDGSRRVIRPARLGLARVSVLRGSGTKEGVPFIDDYIHTSEDVVNYLTEFSGVHPGDLNPHMSAHTLVPLKVAYKKLRLLVDLGCIFIGHGLSKDFRIINIFVPPDQVIDTVDLYFIKERHRRISLRFLTWFILQQDIQQETHDSIEDARSALLLYKAYQDMEGKHEFDDKLDELYRVGREQNWKPPSAVSASPPPLNATPAQPHPAFYSHPSISPSFPSIDPLQAQFQTFSIDPAFRGSYIPMAPELARPYTPPRTPMQHHGRRSRDQHWTSR